MSHTSGTSPVSGDPVELDAADGLVGAVYGRRRHRGRASSRLRRRIGEIRVLARGDDIDLAELLRFLDRLLRPFSGVDVIGASPCRAAGSSAPWRTAASRRPAGTAPCSWRESPAVRAGRLRPGLDGDVLLAAMAHLHHRHAAAVPVEHLLGGLPSTASGRTAGPALKLKMRDIKPPCSSLFIKRKFGQKR